MNASIGDLCFLCVLRSFKKTEIEVSIMIQNHFEMCVLIISPLKPNFGLAKLTDKSVKNGGTALIQKCYFRAGCRFAVSLALNYASTAKILLSCRS